MEINDLVIIGGGPGGLNSALYALRSGLKIKLVEGFVIGGQLNNTSEIDNYLGTPGISGANLGDQMLAHVLQFTDENNIIYENATTIKKDSDNIFSIELEFSEPLYAKSVIIATGCTHTKLNLPNETDLEGRGVSYCATCDGAFFKGKDVVVIGGGNTAIEDALYLSAIAKKVTVIHRRDSLRAESILQERAFSTSNIEFEWNSSAKMLTGATKLASVIVENTKTGVEKEILADGLFIAIGVSPISPQLIFDTNILTNEGFIVTKADMSTEISGLYAIGDIRDKDMRQIITAMGEGALAAKEVLNYLN